MKKVAIIFFLMSLGKIFTLPIGSSNYNIQFVEVSIFATMLVIIISSYRYDLKIHLTSFEKTLIIFQVFCGVYATSTYFWSDYGLSVFPGALSIFIGLISFIVAKLTIKDIKTYENANRILLLSIVIQLILNMSLQIDSININFYSLKDISVTLMGKSNYLSMYLGFIFIYEIIARKRFWLFFTSVSLIGVFLTISKGAFASIALSLIVYLLIILMNKNVKKVKSLLIMIIFSIPVVYLMTNTIIGVELINRIIFTLETGNSSGRDFLIANSLQEFYAQPFGNGVVLEGDPHNVLVKSLRDLGIFTGIIYLIVLLYPVINFLRFKIIYYSNTTIALLVAYLSVIAHSMVEIFFFSSTSIIWTMFTLVTINLALVFEKKERLKRREDKLH